MTGVIKPIMMYGSDCLEQICEPVEEINDETRQIIADLIATCENAPTGVGIAASQIGILKRIVIGENNQVFINPEIIELKGAVKSHREGCLSIPGVYGMVHRPQKIKLKWRDENWEEHESVEKGFSSRILQHEIDHLDGICFPKRMNSHNLSKIKNGLINFEAGISPGEDFKEYPIDWD